MIPLKNLDDYIIVQIFLYLEQDTTKLKEIKGG